MKLVFKSGPLGEPAFWSLCYEVWYYAIFAGFYYPKSRLSKCGWGFAIATLAGPKILLFMPCWLLGALLYWKRDAIKLGTVKAYGLFGTSALSYLTFYWFDVSIKLREEIRGVAPDFVRGISASNQFLGDAILACIVGANFAAVAALSSVISSRLPGSSPSVNRAAAFTLSLYLYHYPVMLTLQHSKYLAFSVWLGQLRCR